MRLPSITWTGVRVLIAHKADVTLKDAVGKTATQIAQLSHAPNVLRLLRSEGVCVCVCSVCSVCMWCVVCVWVCVCMCSLTIGSELFCLQKLFKKLTMEMENNI